MLLKNITRNTRQLFDPKDYGGLILSNGQIECLLHSPISITEENPEERFDDIASAYASGDVRVYDLSKAVGYWKPKPARAKKPAAKKAPSPPPAEPKS